MNDTKALSDLIDAKSQELNVQIAQARPMQPEEIGWIRCKKYVDGLSGNYVQLFLEQKNQDPFSVNKYRNGSMTIIYFYREIEEFKIMVEVIEDDSKVIRKVRYTAFNNDKHLAYTRDIIRWKKTEI